MSFIIKLTLLLVIIMMRVPSVSSLEPLLVDTLGSRRTSALLSDSPRGSDECPVRGAWGRALISSPRTVTRYQCELRVDGTQTHIQRNTKCLDNKFFTNKLGQCGDPDQSGLNIHHPLLIHGDGIPGVRQLQYSINLHYFVCLYDTLFTNRIIDITMPSVRFTKETKVW